MSDDIQRALSDISEKVEGLDHATNEIKLGMNNMKYRLEKLEYVDALTEKRHEQIVSALGHIDKEIKIINSERLINSGKQQGQQSIKNASIWVMSALFNVAVLTVMIIALL